MSRLLQQCLFYHLNNVLRRVQLIKLLIMHLPPDTSSLLGLNIHLSTLFSVTFNVFFPCGEGPSFTAIGNG